MVARESRCQGALHRRVRADARTACRLPGGWTNVSSDAWEAHPARAHEEDALPRLLLPRSRERPRRGAHDLGCSQRARPEPVTMILVPDEAALFYRAWWSLLAWVNDKKHVVPSFPAPTPERPLPVPLAN